MIMNLLLRVLLFAIWSFVVAQMLEFVKSYASGNDRLPFIVGAAVLAGLLLWALIRVSIRHLPIRSATKTK